MRCQKGKGGRIGVSYDVGMDAKEFGCKCMGMRGCCYGVGERDENC